VHQAVDAGVECRAGGATADRMGRHGAVCGMRCVHDRAQHAHRDFHAVGRRVRRGRPRRKTYLGQIRARVDVLLHALDESVRAAGDADASELADAALRSDPDAGGEHARTFDLPGIDRILQCEQSKCQRALIRHGRESRAQVRKRVRPNGTADGEVHVRIDEAGDDRHVPDVDDARCGARVEPRGWDHARYARSADEHNRRAAVLSGTHVEHPRGPDGKVSTLRRNRRSSAGGARNRRREERKKRD
jgi:hypothetical protein